MGELTRKDRRMAAERLGELAEEVRKIAAWLDVSGDHAADKASVMAECARRDLAAAAWLIRPADHSRPPDYLDGSRAERADMPGQHVRGPRLRRPAPWQARTGARSGSLTARLRAYFACSGHTAGMAHANRYTSGRWRPSTDHHAPASATPAGDRRAGKALYYDSDPIEWECCTAEYEDGR